MESRARIAAVVLALGFAAPPLVAQRARGFGNEPLTCDRDRWGDEDRARFCEIRHAGFKAAGGPISVDPGDNGAIRVSGWDGDSVAVTIKVQAQARTDEAAQDMAREVRITASGGTIRADGPAGSGRRSWSVSFDVMVPRRTDLTAHTVNGPIMVGDVAGKMNLSAVNGPLGLSGLGGDVHARTVNGPLVVALSGSRWDGSGLDCETENGPVTITIPAGYSAHLETGTVNGPMSVDYPVTVQGRISFRRLETDIGSGGPTVRAVTTNGPVTIHRD